MEKIFFKYMRRNFNLHNFFHTRLCSTYMLFVDSEGLFIHYYIAQ